MNIVFLLFLVLFFCGGCKKDDVTVNPVVNKYTDLQVIDIHNHDASGYKYKNSLKIWKQFGIDKVVLFGDICEPSAVTTDAIAWSAYQEHPDIFYPFFAGFNIKDSSCLETITNNLIQGYFGIGEGVAASTYSPVTSKLPWKGDHPLDGYFPEVYRLCEIYKVPILMHIDPPTGVPSDTLKKALQQFPPYHIYIRARKCV